MKNDTMTKDTILIDFLIGVMATIAFTVGVTHEGLISQISLVYAGILVGYILTTYMNLEDE